MNRVLRTAKLFAHKTKDGLKINTSIINKIPGDSKTYNIGDSVSSEDPGEVAHYPTEFLNAIAVSEIPPHELKLLPRAIVIL